MGWCPKLCHVFLYSVNRASLYNLAHETNLVHDLFLVYFVNFTYSLYMFRTSPGPSSRGTTVLMRHLVLLFLYSWLSGMQDGMKTSTKCRINTVVPPSDGPAEVRNMTKYSKNKSCTKLVSFTRLCHVFFLPNLVTTLTKPWKEAPCLSPSPFTLRLFLPPMQRWRNKRCLLW